MAYIEHDFPIERLNQIAIKEANAKKPIYQIHKWWARRLGSVFRMLILATFAEDGITETDLWQRFYSKNDLGGKIVLDPFMGGGTTVVEALRLGCKVIGIDLNPVAWFVTKKEIEAVDLNDLDAAFNHLKKTVAPHITKYYKTICPQCYEEVDVMYVFWVKKVPCLNCGEGVRLFPSFRIASKKGEQTVFCPNCHHLQEVKDVRAQITCPECSRRYLPSRGWSGRGKYTCPVCGQKNRILDAVQRGDGLPEAEIFAIEYYCERDGRGYKRADAEDRDLFEAALEEFQRRKDQLVYPRQRIPTEGRSDPRPVNYGYKYFYQMFNERQLLCLSMLLEEILKIEDRNVRELMLLSLSDCVNFNNMFCRYDRTKRHSADLFSRHAYWPTTMPCEGNVWGARLGRNTFEKTFKKTRRAKQYTERPYERAIRNGRSVRQIVGDTAPGLFAATIDEFGAEGKNVLLEADTSEDLSFLTDTRVDAVITDPPYCDNVMYAELADFFYVWLRLALKDAYACFEPEYSPRAREIVKNEALGKDDEFFFKGLTRVFSECRRALKDDGLMVFTFHHREPWAWASVLQSLVDSGFRVVQIYPIHSEMRTSTHLMTSAGIQYDIPFVCRKRLEPGPAISWASLRDKIHVESRELLNRLRSLDRRIADEDLHVIVMGKGLELFTKHYPNVLRDGEQVTVEEAVKDIDGIVETLVKDFELRQLPGHLDEETRLYALYLAGHQDISSSDLNKRIQVGGGDVDMVFDRRYVEADGNILRVTSPKERRDLIESEMRRGKALPQIDRIHYLYDQFTEEHSIRPYLKEWASGDLQAICELLYRKTADKTYKRLADQIRRYLGAREGQLELGI